MKNKTYIWALGLLITPVILLYAPFLGNPLVFDDGAFFGGDEYKQYLHTLFSLNLRWLPYATFVWTRQLLGDAMLWLRLGNLLIHLVNSGVLLFFLYRLFSIVMPNDSENKTLSAFWLAFFAALIFALHPMSVYAAGYLVQRTTLMATLFTLLTWRFFLEGIVQQKRFFLYASALSYFFAVLSKEHAIMAPAVTVILLLLISSTAWQQWRFYYSTFILYALIGLFVVYQVKTRNILGQAYEPFASDIMSQLGEDFDKRLAYPLSILTQTFTFFKYLWLWLVPNPSFMAIDTCQLFTVKFLSLPELFGFITFIAYPFFAIRLLLKRGLQGLLGFALLSPWLLFFTELATVRIQEVFVLYRSYIWMIGLFASLPFLCQKLTAKQAAITLSCIALLILLPLSWLRLDTFSHPFKLWDEAARRIRNDNCPSMARILNNRSAQLIELQHYPEAIIGLNKVIDNIKWRKQQIGSEIFASSYYNRGIAYLKMQQYQLALADFNTIVASTVPNQWDEFHLYKGQTYEGLHELTAAVKEYEKACALNVEEACKKQKTLETTSTP